MEFLEYTATPKLVRVDHPASLHVRDPRVERRKRAQAQALKERKEKEAAAAASTSGGPPLLLALAAPPPPPPATPTSSEVPPPESGNDAGPSSVSASTSGDAPPPKRRKGFGLDDVSLWAKGAEFKIPDFDFDLDGILGNGKGTVYPTFEMDSIYNFQIPEPGAADPTPWKQNPAVPPEGMKPIILSVVASVSLGCTLDLKDIASKGTNLSYNESSFTPLVKRISDPVATAMIFRSGKMVVTGSQSVADCRLAVKIFTAKIRSYGYRVKAFGTRIQNITASCSLGFKVRVQHLGRDKLLSPATIYNPELFTGVAIALPYPRSKIMVFRTGNILITGVRSEEDLDLVFKQVYPVIKIYAV